MRDVRYAWRGLWRTPAFAVITVLTLGLGIGATTAIFSLVNALLIEPLPFRDPQQLVFVWQDLNRVGFQRAPLAAAELHDLRQRATLFSGFGGIWSNTTVLSGDQPEQLRIGLVTADFFTILGAQPALGRTFVADDRSPDAPRAILLSHSLWQRRYGSDPSLVGRTVDVDGHLTTVIGVMPRGFRLMMPPDASVPDDLQAWLLLGGEQSFSERPRGQRFLRVVGRMKPGVSPSSALHELGAIGQAISREHAFYASSELTLFGVELHADAMREIRPTLLMLFGGVSILLIVACVNVAGLLVARAAARTRETALRIAIGASRGRLLRQYAVEGLVLGALGGIAGLLVGRLCLALLIALRPEPLSRIDTASLDPRVMTFAALVALTWGLLLSFAPLAEIRKDTIALGLQAGSRDAGAALRIRRRAVLVVCQLALSVVLIVGAALLARTFVSLVNTDPGFSSDNILTFRVAVSGARYDSRAAVHAFSTELRSRLSALPGVTSVGAISHLPYDELPNWGTPAYREGDTNPERAPSALTRAITPGFFETVGTRLIAGRFFTEADDVTSVPVAIVDERLAARMWPGESAIGQRFVGDPQTTGKASVVVTVVGVVRHVRHRQPTLEQGEQIYYPVKQAIRNPMAYLVKSPTDPAALAPLIRAVLKDVDPTLPMYDVRPLSAYVVSARASRRFAMLLAGAFAVLSLVLGAIGVYGVMAYSVAGRRRELGVRLALGASRRQIARLVMGESLRLAAGGLAVGLIGAAVSAGLLRSQLYGVPATDPIAFGLAVPTLALAVALAAWLPTRRATRTNPAESLRSE